jgi:hypothetical protein
MNDSTSASQMGGESTYRGMDYQKKFIAYLCTQMLLGKAKINRIRCEHLDDIEVQTDPKTIYYQIKSRSQGSLPRIKIVESFKLFLSINNFSNKESTEREYILVSNAKIANFDDSWTKHRFNELASGVKTEIMSIEGVSDDFLKKTYLMKGPALEDIWGMVVTALVQSLKDKSYNYIEIANELLHHINKMCSGVTDLQDKKIMEVNEKVQHDLEHKSMDMEKLNRIIKNHVITKPATDLKRVSKELTSSYDIRVNDPNEEELEEFHELLDEFNDFPEGDEKRYAYLEIFNKKSRVRNLHKDKQFLEFLEKLLNNSNDKHIILECLFILDNLITTSKTEKDASFLQYVKTKYFDLFQNRLEMRDERFENSLFKIEQILARISAIINPEQLCEMYWKRMKKIIQDMNRSGITDNALWNCILHLKNCKIKREWRKWLIQKDEYSNIKDAVLRDLKLI